MLLTLAALSLPLLAADVTGTWKSEFDSQIGLQKYTYTLKQDGTNLTGKANSEVNDQRREVELKEGKIDGDKISFFEMLNFQGNDIRITYAKDGLIRISQGVHTYLKEKNVPHIWHVDGNVHGFKHWKMALYQFSQLIFKSDAK
jgi:hypothetical protein